MPPPYNHPKYNHNQKPLKEYKMVQSIFTFQPDIYTELEYEIKS